MKSLKYLAAAMLAAAFAHSASAQTVIHITGSTAYRGATHTAITHILTAGFTYGYTGATLSGAGQAVFTGNVGANAVIIKTSWTGSVGGVQTVASSTLKNAYLDNAAAQSTGGTSGLAAGTNQEFPDVAMSDTYQSATDFRSPILHDQIVGVVPFKWVASGSAPSGLSNITPQLAQVLFGNGSLPLALFSGLHADQGTLVYATGRDPDSGTRLTAFAESGVGVSAQVVQYEPLAQTGTTITTHQPWHAITVNGIPVVQGNGGFSSGGTLATTVGKTLTIGGNPAYYVTYLSTGDANTAITAGAKELTYNGVTYSSTRVEEGDYTFWGYEHLMYKNSLAAIPKAVADTLANQLLNTDATVLTSTMQVSRSADGGNVTPLY